MMIEEIAYKVQTSMLVRRTTFPGRLIYYTAYITCPAHLPDIVVSDYFLWGYAQIEVHEICLADVGDCRNSESGNVFKGSLKNASACCNSHAIMVAGVY
jgi:hypothetical protein